MLVNGIEKSIPILYSVALVVYFYKHFFSFSLRLFHAASLACIPVGLEPCRSLSGSQKEPSKRGTDLAFGGAGELS